MLVSLAHWSWPDGQRPWPEKRKRGREEEEHTHHTPRRMSGRHGGAVPARPARDYLGRTSPRHHRRSTHTLGQPQARTARPVRRSGEVWVWRRQEPERSRAEIEPRSRWRGTGFQIHSVEEEEGRGEHLMIKCRRRKSPELVEICRRRRWRHRSQEELGRRREGCERGESGLGRFDRPRPESLGLVS
jgi:hypothetical protein